MKEFIFIWKIENISYSWHKMGEMICSPSFTAGPIYNSVWILQLRPRGFCEPDYFGLFLHRENDSGVAQLQVNFELSCLSSDNLPLNSCIFNVSDKTFSKNDGFGHPRFVRSHEVFFNRKALYLPLEILTLRCRMWINGGTSKEFGQSIGYTQLKIERILLNETINLTLLKNVIDIHSKNQNKSLISISMLPRGNSIRLEIHPINVERIKFSVLKLSLYDKNIGKNVCEHVSSWLDAPRIEGWSLPLKSKLDAVNEDSIKDNVELLGEFVYSNGEETNHLENNQSYDSVNRQPYLVSKYLNCIASERLSNCSKVSQELWYLYLENILCDFEIKTQTSSFFVHRIVLCARSPVFLAMLTGDMKEKRSECIEIDDIANDILQMFFLFLYTDTIEDLEWEEAIGLYYAADKYQVERLKLHCCSYLLENVNVVNVCEVLMLADRHHDSNFKKRVEDFILKNDKEIFSSSAWKQFAEEQPLLSVKIMLLKYDTERGKENATESFEEKLTKHPDVQDDLRALYRGEILCDIVIKTRISSFPTHMAVLCASSTLKKLFIKHLQGKPTEAVEMEDLEDGIVSRMLLFLYTDSFVDVQWDSAIKLYHAADVY